MKNVALTIVTVLSSFSLYNTSLYATATETKCNKDGWEKSPAAKHCTVGTIEEDPANRRTCRLKNVTCHGVANATLSMQPHQFQDLNACNNYLKIGSCSDIGPLVITCQKEWEKSAAFKLNACKGTVQTDPSDPNMCQLKMTCSSTDNKLLNNKLLTFTVSEVSQLNLCNGLLKTGVCKSK